MESGNGKQMKYSYEPQGVCSFRMDFDIDGEGIVTNVKITGGCPGNTQGVARLAEGRKADELIALLSGIRCGNKPTSCPNQLARALLSAQNKRGDFTSPQKL